MKSKEFTQVAAHEGGDSGWFINKYSEDQFVLYEYVIGGNEHLIGLFDTFELARNAADNLT